VVKQLHRGLQQQNQGSQAFVLWRKQFPPLQKQNFTPGQRIKTPPECFLGSIVLILDFVYPNY
jgi:hypothetical protein